MKVLLHVRTADAVRAGLDECGRRTVVLSAADLTLQQREALARNQASHDVTGQTRADFDLSGSSHRPIAFTVDEAIACIDAHVAEYAAEAIEKAQRKEEQRAQHEAQVAYFLAASISEFFKQNPNTGQWYLLSLGASGPPYAKLPDDPRLEDRIAEARGLVRDTNDAEAREKAEAKDRRRRDEEAGEATLRSWSDEHGSELLKARLAEGFEWKRLAQAEFGEKVFVSLGIPLADDPSEDVHQRDCLTPSLDEIESLRLVRRRIKQLELPACASLVRMHYSTDDGPDVTRNEIEITVTTPDGDSRDFYVLPEDVEGEG